MAGELRRIYHDLNAHLVERQILPEMRADVPAQSAVAARAKPGRHGRVRGKPAPGRRPPMSSAAARRQLLARGIRRLPGAEAAGERPRAPGLAAAARGFVQALPALQQLARSCAPTRRARASSRT